MFKRAINSVLNKKRSRDNNKTNDNIILQELLISNIQLKNKAIMLENKLDELLNIKNEIMKEINLNQD